MANVLRMGGRVSLQGRIVDVARSFFESNFSYLMVFVSFWSCYSV